MDRAPPAAPRLPHPRLPQAPERRLIPERTHAVTDATESDRSLLALAAVFAPAVAGRLLSRLGAPCTEPLRAEGVRIASLPRRARLLALAESLLPVAALRAECVESLATGERPRTSAVLRSRIATRDGSANGGSALAALRRLVYERLRSPAG